MHQRGDTIAGGIGTMVPTRHGNSDSGR